MVLEQQNIHMKRLNLNSYFISYTKIYLKWIINLKITARDLKLIEENTAENTSEPGVGKDFLDWAQKAQDRKLIIELYQNYIVLFQYIINKEIVKSHNGKKYSQYTHKTKDLYPEYLNNCYYSVMIRLPNF